MRDFPVLQAQRGTLRWVPWSIMERGRRRALQNHQQTLERLAERGGCDYLEIICILTDTPCSHFTTERKAIELKYPNPERWLREVIAEEKNKNEQNTA